MSALNRRRFLQGSAALALGAAVGGCSTSTSGSQGGGAGKGAGVSWWDHFSSYQKLNDDWAGKQSSALGVPVTHTYYEASKAPEALQVANQARQLPDVFSNVVGVPLAALVKDKWVQELKLSADVLASLPKGTLAEGITSLDGKVYGFPLQSSRWYTACTWFNVDLFAKAGLDPNAPPATYDDYRAACQKLKDAGVVPMTLALGADGGRVRDEMDDMAQTGGFDGYQGVQFKTGQYAYDDDAYVNGIEFWKELYDGGFMLPGTNNFSVVNARTRYATGAVCFFIDGPWLPGGSKVLQPTFLPKIGGGSILTAEPGKKVMTYHGLPGPTYFVSGTSQAAENATKLIASFVEQEYLQQMTAAMDQPPVNLDIVATADVIEPYKQMIARFTEQVFWMPQPVVRNNELAAVDARRKPITPHLGQIIQGYLGGNIPDLRAALKKLSDDNEADRERALKEAKTAGAKVALEDYAFADWQPGRDYVYKK